MINHHKFEIGKCYQIKSYGDNDDGDYAFKEYNKEADFVDNLFQFKKADILVLEKIRRSEKMPNGILLKVLLDGGIAFLWFDVDEYEQL